MKFRICVIGCGAMSTSVHGPSFKKYASTYPDTELSACCDLVREKAEVYKEKFGFKKAYTSYDEMLEKEKPHAVCLITNVIHTKDLAVDIMRKGFPVLMEKPPGINPSECEEIICVSEETEPGMRYCLITPRLVEDGFGNGDSTPCKKHEQKPPMRADKPFGHDIIREEDGLGPIDTDGD